MTDFTHIRELLSGPPGQLMTALRAQKGKSDE
jgi:hypothetical protein